MNPRALRITKLAIVLVLFGANAGSAAAYSLVVIRQGNGDFRHLHWPEGTLPVSFQLNDQTGPGLANVTDDSDPAGAVNRSLAKWPAVCGVRMTLGSTAVADAVVDGINVITFADTETNRQIFEMAGSAVGLTLGSFRGETITETDILFNPNLTFTTTVDSDEALENADMFDVEGVVTHELGHSIGLHHSGVESATMWAIATVGARSLDPDDIAGARTLYPVGELDGIRGTVRVNGAPAFGAHVVAVADSGPVFSAGARQICEIVSLWAPGERRCASLPEVFEAAGEHAAPQRDDRVGARHRPVHPGALEPGGDGGLAAGLHNAG